MELFSEKYQDYYHSLKGGLKEAHHVFIQPLELEDRLRSSLFSPLVVGELGFGYGLNFLATWKTWKNSHPRPLHFISIDETLLPKEIADFQLSQYPELKNLKELFLLQYPKSIPGFHRLHFENFQVQLTLVIGKAPEIIHEICGLIDTWYFDGFCPRKNPDMWSLETFRAVAACSKPGETRFSTYSSASFVQKNLREVGFEVHKRQGFGKKREMLTGTFRGSTPSSSHPWFELPQPLSKPPRVSIVGAGLSGAACAQAFSQRGIPNQVLEKYQRPAEGTSKIYSGTVFPTLTRKASPLSQWNLHAYLYAVRKFFHLKDIFHQTGLIQLATQTDSKQKFQTLSSFNSLSSILSYEPPDILSDRAGIKINHPGLFFKEGGFLSPFSLCERQLETPPTECLFHTELTSTRFDKTWEITDQMGRTFQSDVLIFSQGSLDSPFWNNQQLPLSFLRGQLAFSEQALPLKTVLSYEGYLTPWVDGRHVVGSTFQRNDTDSHVRTSDLNQIQKLMEKTVPSLGKIKIHGGMTRFRCTSPDTLPVIGPIPQWDLFQSHFKDLVHGKKPEHFPSASSLYFPQLYTCNALGSKGILYAQLSAEVLVSMIIGEPLPIPRSLMERIHPSRFFIRNLRRGLLP